MQCPECDGKGGGVDYFGEWDDCRCCEGKGKVTKKHHREWVAENDRIDEQIHRDMTTPCAKCGAIIGDHVNRHGDPCKTAQQWNAENGYA